MCTAYQKAEVMFYGMTEGIKYWENMKLSNVDDAVWNSIPSKAEIKKMINRDLSEELSETFVTSFKEGYFNRFMEYKLSRE